MKIIEPIKTILAIIGAAAIIIVALNLGFRTLQNAYRSVSKEKCISAQSKYVNSLKGEDEALSLLDSVEPKTQETALQRKTLLNSRRTRLSIIRCTLLGESWGDLEESARLYDAETMETASFSQQCVELYMKDTGTLAE